MGITEAAQDISFDAMVLKQNLVTEIVKNDPAVASVTSAVGSGGGGSLNTGRMFITLKPRRERNLTATEVVARIRGKTARIPGIGVFLQASQDIRIGGRATKGQYIYSLVSPSQDDLNSFVPKLMAALQKNPKLKDLTTDQQQQGLQSNVVVDRIKASQLGIQPEQVDSALYSAFGQRAVSVVYNDRDQFHVILEALPQYLADPTALDKMYISGTAGIQVPLSAIAHFQFSNTPTAINHQGQFPAVTFSFNLDPGTSLEQATTIIEKAASDIHMPDSIRGSFQGTAQVFQDSLSSEPILILTAIIAVYIVLGILYESYIHPITILSTLPSAGLGALLALLLCKVDLSIVSIIGIILLIGIVKKNAIMMVDFALEAEREQNLSPADAIYPGLRCSVSSHHDDHPGCNVRRGSAGDGSGRRVRNPTTARRGDYWRSDRVTAFDLVHDTDHLPLSGSIAGTAARNGTRGRSAPRVSSLPATKPRRTSEIRAVCRRTRNSGSFRAVAQYLSVFGAANRPEFRFLDLFIPWIFVISVVWLSGGLAGRNDPGATPGSRGTSGIFLFSSSPWSFCSLAFSDSSAFHEGASFQFSWSLWSSFAWQAGPPGFSISATYTIPGREIPRSGRISSASRLAFPVRSFTSRSTIISRSSLGTCCLKSIQPILTAQLNVASGQVLNSEANLKQRQQDLDRQSNLYKNHVVAEQDFQNAQDNFSAAQAQLVSAKANLELARLNLSYTKVFAPVDGYVTNMNTSEGTYVTAGKQLMALVDGSSFWIAAYFKETQLPHIQIGQKANCRDHGLQTAVSRCGPKHRLGHLRSRWIRQ